MLVTEIIQPEVEGGWTLVRNYSSLGMMICQNETDDLYAEAIDPDFTNRTYTETNIPIEREDTVENKATEMVDTLLGE